MSKGFSGFSCNSFQASALCCVIPAFGQLVDFVSSEFSLLGILGIWGICMIYCAFMLVSSQLLILLLFFLILCQQLTAEYEKLDEKLKLTESLLESKVSIFILFKVVSAPLFLTAP